MNVEINEVSGPMGATHSPSMNLRFVKRDERFILQQMFVPKNWNTHDEEWLDIPLHEEAT